jgi:hypothetical protein
MCETTQDSRYLWRAEAGKRGGGVKATIPTNYNRNGVVAPG